MLITTRYMVLAPLISTHCFKIYAYLYLCFMESNHRIKGSFCLPAVVVQQILSALVVWNPFF